MSHPHPYQHKEFTVWQIPVLRDNYSYVLLPRQSNTAWVVDPALADPVTAFCAQQQRQLRHIWNTHHHWDHTDGNRLLQQSHGCTIWGASSEVERIPGLDQGLSDDQCVEVDGLNVQVIATPGHTDGHLVFLCHHALFCGDALFSAGCGRIFEGTHEQMLQSLLRLYALDEQSHVYCAHEYTAINMAFAMQLAQSLDDPDYRRACEHRQHEVTQLRAHSTPTVPSTLAEEKRSNPFLQVWRPVFLQAYAQAHSVAAESLAVFTHMREWRNRV